MKKLLLIASLTVCLPAMAQTAFTVNGQLISTQKQKQIMGVLASQGISDTKQQAQTARNILAQQAIIEQAARKEKIDQSPNVQALLDARRAQIYTDELVRKNVLNKPFTDKELQDTYAEMKKAYDPNEIKVRHILVKTEDEAKTLINKITAGEDMAKLAKENSLDKATTTTGGEIPFTNIRRIAIPGFAEAAVALNKGQLLAIPFRSSLGYHVIRLEDKREVPFPEYDKIKPQVQNLLAQKKASEYINGLMKAAKFQEAGAADNKNAKKK